jgi:acyl dehydratase
MIPELKGKVLKTHKTRAYAAYMKDLEATLGTPTAAETARVALFFGVTIARDFDVLEKMGMVLNETLMGGHEIAWARPFEPDEEVEVTVTLADVQDRGKNRIAVIESLFQTPGGEEIQRQYSTFVHLGGAGRGKTAEAAA